ncbi:hypothetical protein [Actinomyces radicidentis]|uniref:hypothetical protein n=1 Tax=Actinomyces radicidentis TaxID=111015 RepID=UPI0028EB3707|nr:hypothetical protein [Actinomyces radicidentis]
MSTTTATRRDAARVLGRFMGTRRARDLFAANGYVNGTRILPVLESDPFDEILANHTQSGETTIIAVYYPDRSGDAQLDFMKWEAPATSTVPPDVDPSTRLELGRSRSGHTSSVGMVLDYMNNRIKVIDAGELTSARIPAALEAVASKAFAIA